ncbi:hypothetical protein FB008_11263 [Sinorhizobium medicae]|nr:hypothetical protein FB008_11263 [Sinorhizobium medicae]
MSFFLTADVASEGFAASRRFCKLLRERSKHTLSCEVSSGTGDLVTHGAGRVLKETNYVGEGLVKSQNILIDRFVEPRMDAISNDSSAKPSLWTSDCAEEPGVLCLRFKQIPPGITVPQNSRNGFEYLIKHMGQCNCPKYMRQGMRVGTRKPRTA